MEGFRDTASVPELSISLQEYFSLKDVSYVDINSYYTSLRIIYNDLAFTTKRPAYDQHLQKSWGQMSLKKALF